MAGADKHCQDLAVAAGLGNRRWHAYLSAQAANGGPTINARDRIGQGPWYNVKGVLITSVDPSVAQSAPDKRLSAGDVIVEVQYQAVGNPSDLQSRIDQLKSQGKKVAVLLVSNADGETRFVALSLQ